MDDNGEHDTEVFPLANALIEGILSPLATASVYKMLINEGVPEDKLVVVFSRKGPEGFEFSVRVFVDGEFVSETTTLDLMDDDGSSIVPIYREDVKRIAEQIKSRNYDIDKS